MMLELLARALEAPLVVGEASVTGEAGGTGEASEAGEAVEAGGAAAVAAVVVLGVPLAAGGELSAVGVERVAAGVTLWRAARAPQLILAGGATRGARRSEASAMAAWAARAGVPGSALVAEERSRTTAENAREVARLLPAGAPVWVVTQPFHGRRARWWFREVGLRPAIWHLADSLQYRDRRRALGWLGREYAAWARLLVTAGLGRRT